MQEDLHTEFIIKEECEYTEDPVVYRADNITTVESTTVKIETKIESIEIEDSLLQTVQPGNIGTVDPLLVTIQPGNIGK